MKKWQVIQRNDISIQFNRAFVTKSMQINIQVSKSITLKEIFFLSVLLLSLLTPIMLVVARENARAMVAFFSILDELTLLVMTFYVFGITLVRFKVNKAILFLLIFVIYALALLIINNIPKQNLIQIILDCRLFIYGIFFLYLSRQDIRYTKLFQGLLVFIVITSVLVSGVQVISPDFYYNLTGIIRHERGIGGINLSSIFYSRVAFAQFLFISIILSLCLKSLGYKAKGVFDLKHNYILFIMVVMLIFTFSRKELIFLVVFMPVFYLISYDKVSIKKLFVLVPLCLTVLFVLWAVMGQETNAEFTDKYVRFQMLGYAVQIILDYFPLGSGPGTYGSLFSLEYTDIYQKYMVSDRIVYGVNDFGRGPIFDLFLISLTAEYGIGILIYLLFIYSLVPNKKNSKIKWFYCSSLALFLVYCSIVTPAFTNLTGILIMAAIFAIRKATHFSNSIEMDK